MMIAYTGNSAYCFTNSLHMSLQAAGMDDVPPQWFLESLTMMPFGVALVDFGEDWLFLPSSFVSDPDSGVDHALACLGWTADDHHGMEAEAASAALRHALESGPAMVGPVDFGYLTSNPMYFALGGSDHYVLVTAFEGDMLRLHDPDHCPYGTIPIPDFMQAWKAEKMRYGKRPYQFRSNFRQSEDLSRAEMMARCLPKIKEAITAADARPNVWGGPQAFQRVANRVKDGINDDKRGFLIHFALPLGARRSSDGARFVCEAGLNDLGAQLTERAKAYGEADYYAIHRQWEKLAAVLEGMADIEAGFIELAG